MSTLGPNGWIVDEIPTTLRWSDSTGTALVRPDGGSAALASAAGTLIDASRPNNCRGVLVCDWSVGGTGTPSSTDAFPEAGFPTIAVPSGVGPGGTFYATANALSQSSSFSALGFWAKAGARTDGVPYTSCRIDLGTTTAFNIRAFCTFTVSADGKWRFYALHSTLFGVNGGFVLGTTTFDYVRMIENGTSTAITFTGGPAAGATAATLSAGFAGTTNIYPVRFSTNEVRYCQLVNGSTAVAWGDPLTATATTSAVYSVDRLPQLAGEAMAWGPVYRNPTAKAFAYIRMDDGVADQYTARQTLATDYVGTSGVTIPAGVPQSMLSILNAFGLKGSAFVLTRHVGAAGFMTAGQLQELQNVHGWAIGFQSHANPLNLPGAGLRLLGPYGYYYSAVYGSIASVDTGANTITTAIAHQITQVTAANFGNQGFPVEFTGTDLPAPLVAGTQYWLRNTSTTAFAVHSTEADAVAGTNTIDLTTAGTAANFGFRYWGSAADESAIAADFATGRWLLESWGLRAGAHYAMNQGGFDAVTESVVSNLMSSGALKTCAGIFGFNGVVTGNNYMPRVASGWSTAGIGYTALPNYHTSVAPYINLPVSIGTESVVEATVRSAVLHACNRGHIISFYHHGFGSETQCRQFIAACDEIKLRVDQGILMTGTVDELYEMLVNGGTEG